MWIDIKGYEGIYQISENGQIRSLPRLNSAGRFLRGRLRKLEVDRDGYLKVGLTKNNIQRRFLVSRLVAHHFLPNPKNNPIVNHIDGIKSNNHVSNLEWASIRDNNLHAVAMNLRNGYQGSKNYNAKLNEADVIKIKTMLAKHMPIKEIAQKFRVSFATIGFIKQKRTWRHVTI